MKNPTPAELRMHADDFRQDLERIRNHERLLKRRVKPWNKRRPFFAAIALDSMAAAMEKSPPPERRKPKHRQFKIQCGYYNYRGYYIVRCGRAWTVMNEDDSVAARSRTLRAMRRKVNGWYAIEARNERLGDSLGNT